MTPAPILIDKKTAAALLSISVGMLDKITRQGKIEPVYIGRKVLYRREDVEALALTDHQKRAMRRKGPGGVQ